MERYFGFDTRFARIMTKIADLMILNAVFLVSCIPVFIIGSAMAALYSVAMQMCRNEESYIIKSFLKEFRGNFCKGTILWGIIAGSGLILYSSFRMFGAVESNLLKGEVISVSVLWLLIVPYFIPIVVVFDRSVGKTLQMGILVSLRHLGCSMVIFCMHFLLIVCIMVNGKIFYSLLAFFALIGFSTLAYMCSNIYNRIFEKYIS